MTDASARVPEKAKKCLKKLAIYSPI